MTNIWKKGSDNLIDGTALAIILSIVLIWGQTWGKYISDWFVSMHWTWLDSINYSVSGITFTSIVLIIGISALVGYIIDRI